MDRNGVILPGNVVSLLDYFSSLLKKCRKGLTLICHATLWKIWEVRNDVIFSSKIARAKEIVEGIKVTSWIGFLAKKKGGLVFVL